MPTILTLLAACQGTDATSDSGTSESTPSTTDTTPPPTPPPTTTSESGDSADTGTPTTTGATGDTGVGPLDATGMWSGPCNYGPYNFTIRLDLVETAGVVTGSGSFQEPGYPAFPLTVDTGSRVGVDVSLDLTMQIPGYAGFPADWAAPIVADEMVGHFTLHQPGYPPAVTDCDLTR